MRHERYQRVKEILAQALELPVEEHEAFLAEACGDDSELFGDVTSLLGYAQDASLGSVENAALAQLPYAGWRLADPGGRHYQIVRLLGHGGMGTVYLAERTDGEYRQEVALKLVHPRLVQNEKALDGFRTERQILAELQHPNIARLLDGGQTTEGLPYFAMEYVEGERIDRYCDRHVLSVDARLRLFRATCLAVHYAHQNLVVHRDLKPNNILVTPEGTPKLLDFGIAKILDPKQATALTVTADHPLTPRYASPEQVRGGTLTTATDIYSLGVVLYELLVSHPPFRGESLQELLEAICDQEPTPPSTAVRLDATEGPAGPERTRRAFEPERLQRRLRGDLDHIVLKALRKEPRERYASAEQFAEDIRRHLEGQPVIARAATWRYRAGKFLRRNRIAVSAAAAGVVLILAFALSTVLQSRRIARERDTAQQVSSFLVDLFEVSDPGEAQGNTITAREILDRGAEKVARTLRDQPEVQANLMDTMGRVYSNLGLYETAVDLLNEALTLRRSLYGERHAAVADSLLNLGWARFHQTGDPATAEPLVLEALEIDRSLFGDEHPVVATALNFHGLLRFEHGDLQAAEEFLRQALTVRRRLLPEDHRDLLSSVNNLGLVLHNSGDYLAAESLYREASTLGRRILGTDHPDTATMIENLALLLDDLGKGHQAETLHREALEIRRRVLGERHLDVGDSLRGLARSRFLQHDLGAAEQHWREALTLYRSLLDPEHPTLGPILLDVSRVLEERGEPEEAEALCREGLRLLQSRLGEENLEVAFAMERLGQILKGRGQLGEAERLFREVLRRYAAVLPDGHVYTAESLFGLGSVLTAGDNAAGAEPYLRKAVDILRRRRPPGHRETAEAENDLGACLTALGRYEEAEELLLRSLEATRTIFGEENRRTRKALARLVRLYEAWGKPAIWLAPDQEASDFQR